MAAARYRREEFGRSYGDTYEEVHQSTSTNGTALSQVRNALCQSLVGICLYVVALVAVVYGERSTMCYAKALGAARSSYLSIECDGRREVGDQGRPIHFSCPIAKESMPTWTPQSFGAEWLSGAFSVQAVKVRQEVAMYQCKETKHSKKVKGQGNTEQVVDSWTYKLDWFSEHIPSGNFKGWTSREAMRAIQSGCGGDFAGNPPFPMNSQELSAPSLIAGGFDLSRHMSQLRADSALILRQGAYQLPARFATEKRVAKDGKAYTRSEFIDFYGEERGSSEWEWASGVAARAPGTAVVRGDTVHSCEVPAVGCLRLRFHHSPASHVSHLAASGPVRTTEPWSAPGSWLCGKGSSGTSVDLFAAGEKSAQKLLEEAESSNSLSAWAFRALGLVLAISGVYCFLQPLQTAADFVDQVLNWFRFIPLLGGLLDFVGDVVSGLTAGAIALASIGLGLASVLAVLCVTWSVMLGVPLLVLGVVACAYVYAKTKKPKKQ